jgi:hypothetical protein
MMKLFMLAGALSLSLSGAVLAAADNVNNGSACGQAHAARADVYGNYGFLGQVGGTPGYHNGATGQDPDATGYNNSHTGCNSPS